MISVLNTLILGGRGECEDEMTASLNFARYLRMSIEQDARGVYVAKSPDLKGLLAVSKDRVELEETVIPQAIRDLYLACGEDIVVTRLEETPPRTMATRLG